MSGGVPPGLIDPAEALIDHALAVEWTALPAAVQRATLDFLHDSLCVGVAGSRAAHSAAVLEMVQGWGEGGAAGALGMPGVRLPAASAAFVNGYFIHNQEYDCVHEPAVLHPMATLLAALLAETSRGPVSGADFLSAIAAGADVSIGLGVGAGPLSFFRPATAGIFGCVAGIARLRRLRRATALDAFGHALSFASGTMQAHVEGKPALPVQVANAARGGLVAADMALAGMAGVAKPIGGDFGYYAVLERAGELKPMAHRIAEVSWKPFPTGRAAHGGIVAIRRLMADGLTADSFERLDYHAPPLIARLVGRPAVSGMAPGYARLCLPWLAAVVLTRGTVSLGDFTPERLADAELVALAQRVRVVADDNGDPAAFVPATAIATLRDGREIRAEVAAQFGSPEWPLSRDEHLAKALGCLEFAGLGASHAALAAAVETLACAPDALALLESTGVLG
ncbi:MmgE/PrpD family protein [Sandaracinobacteroides hominis]|uniref:MmgE/PrpD family protein n=1 Tax=Sandaracinobacteroides hominis TaxID=2780086 RepID=UPI0018F3855E|nr:MmgE/PrpD family protein [Sandaracinobacteroides hominis]